MIGRLAVNYSASGCSLAARGGPLFVFFLYGAMLIELVTLNLQVALSCLSTIDEASKPVTIAENVQAVPAPTVWVPLPVPVKSTLPLAAIAAACVV